MSEHTQNVIYVTGVIVWILATLTYVGVSGELEAIPGFVLAFVWPFIAGLAIIIGAGWLYIEGVRRLWARLHRPAPQPDAYAVAAQREVERIVTNG